MIKNYTTKNFAFFFVLLLVQISSNSAFSADYASNYDVIKEIEKTLLFDKDSREKINVYKKKSSTKKSNFTISAGEKTEAAANQSIEIVVVDPKSQNFDLREKEKLAYNSALIGQYEVAIELYKTVIAAEPENNYSKFSLAVVYQKLGQFRQAKTIYRDLLKNNPNNQDEIIGNLLSILIEESPQDATYLLSRLTAQNPNSAYIIAQAALAYDKNKNYPKAISLLERAISIDNENALYKYNLAVIYDKTHQNEKAINLYSSIAQSYSVQNNAIPVEQVQKRLESLRSQS